MKTYIVSWTGSFQFEAATPEDAITMMKRYPDVLIACSELKADEYTQAQKEQVAQCTHSSATS